MKINQRLDLLGDVLGIWFCAKNSPMLPFSASCARASALRSI